MGKYLDLHDVASGHPVAMAEYNEMLSEIAELRSERNEWKLKAEIERHNCAHIAKLLREALNRSETAERRLEEVISLLDDLTDAYLASGASVHSPLYGKIRAVRPLKAVLARKES